MIRQSLAAFLLTTMPLAAQESPRIAVMSAFEPEWISLQADLEGAESQVINGTEFITGKLSGQDVVLFLSGVSMVNAAMTTQLALDRFDIEAIVFSGIAGGVDPSLNIGDVVVAEEWGQWLETVMARAEGDGFALPGFLSSPFPNLGMIFTRETTVASDRGEPETRFWFPADPDLLAVAKEVAAETDLADCNTDDACLSEPPVIRVGGHGVSGSSFLDNAEIRDWLASTFEAQVVDMESAAVAQVAWANQVPFIAFRSLSDLAGGGEGENEMGVFMSLASENSAALVKAFLAAMPSE
ncbi:5'-methylthioadenosine/S-adenosylhomocysteine nucleosidase (plasmid) [Paracoccus sp. TK19116]|uniref:5'-methylthioadenosine/S-adenosylhomocysteine nucleosidase n=1 Tax=Paracoccus albicereus TaxID=2922394 RepID=A0ABT1MLX0_9RHOB|nr:5'-methylthioadenosine/S-adenosylhomocysteine nucleosidase [Paracoccus albicereus]MCQ0969272.1 5'-methylthioadenosine/S-adenosylhomocysteine nucleosidase [Paracoccus albicereus]